jgi:hypothetical protein
MKGQECEPQMISAFIIAGSAESLDTSCVARMQRPDFVLSLEPEVKLKPEELERLTGTWTGQDGLTLKADVIGGLLRVAFPNGAELLAATSPTSFRLRSGEPGFSITFSVQDGRAVSMVLEEPEGTSTLTRK